MITLFRRWSAARRVAAAFAAAFDAALAAEYARLLTERDRQRLACYSGGDR